MKAATRQALVLVNAPNKQVARKLAQAALKAKLIACANLVPSIESHYWWEGKLAKGSEVLLLLKTTQKHLVELEQVILANHPYDTPEFIVLPIKSGNTRYLDWITASVK